MNQLDSIYAQAEALPTELNELCRRLCAAAGDVDMSHQWPAEQMRWCAEAGVYRWFISPEYGGLGWSERELLAAYLQLSRSCLTTTFILTQWVAACRRIQGSQNAELRQRLLPQLADGSLFATVGISHLTTSRQHVAKPILRAEATESGHYRLDGFTPWVTSAAAADLLVVGATVEGSSEQLIVAVPAGRSGIKAGTGANLVALSSSCTDRIDFHQVRVEASEVVAGPIENVMQSGSGGGAGGLQTSTLAVGLALAATEFIATQGADRPDLQPIADKLQADTDQLASVLDALTCGRDATMAAPELRQKANSLVLRSTQAALSAAKGAGFLATHPTGRWAREALFFLVWSCPQPVMTANLCELAQLE